MGWLYQATHPLAEVMVSALFRLRVIDRDHVPETGPVLLLSNHQSFLDPVLCAVGLKREINFMARDSLFYNPLFGRYIKALNAFPVKRGQADIMAIKEILKRLKADQAVLLFPEATRTRDGHIRPFKSGFELIARRGSAAIVPTVIDGAYEAWPRQNPLPLPGRIFIRYGRAISLEEQKGYKKDGLVNEVNRQMRTMQNELRKQFDRKPFCYG